MQQKHLLTRARSLRSHCTPYEAILWRHLSRAQLGGYKFRRQHVIDNAIVDFFCPAKGLIVEVDGDTHDADQDRLRDARHSAMGFATIRFTNIDVRQNLDGVLTTLLDRLQGLPDRWVASGALPHPPAASQLRPSPEGEGI